MVVSRSYSPKDMHGSNSGTKLYVILSLLVLLITVIWTTRKTYMLNQELAEINRQVLAGREENTRLRNAISHRNEKKYPHGIIDDRVENENDSWIQGVYRLASYLSTNSSLGIPEMQLLSASDWLDAVSSTALETEADYRKALAYLRWNAKMLVAPEIRDALTSYLADSGGEIPENIEELFEYTKDSSFGQETLSRFNINPSGKFQNFHVADQNGNQNFVLVEKTNIDEVWDSQLLFSDKAGFGFKKYNDRVDGVVRSAIESYTKKNGRPPVVAADLESYVGEKVDSDRLEAIFEALNSRPF